MKILAAFDSFKESMTAYQAGEAVKIACADMKDVTVTIKPLADGGEGTMSAINSALSGTIHELFVTGPDFRNVDAQLAIIGDLAIIECAQACGLEYLKEEEKNGALMTSLGVGEMIHYAAEHGAHTIVITLGGSATNDGGIGMLAALGVRFYDLDGGLLMPVGASLTAIDHIDLGTLHERYGHITFKGLCDVDNPLVGKKGATYVFGMQKGIAENDLARLDAGLRRYGKLSAQVNGQDDLFTAGAGAAGGLGFAIVNYLKGTLTSGIDEVMRLTHLEEAVAECDLILTGEGKMDAQTLMGKAPQGVLKLALKYHKPIVAFAGQVNHKEALLQAGFSDVRCINHDDIPLMIQLREGMTSLAKEVRQYLKETYDV